MDMWAIQHDSSYELLCWDMLFGTVTLDLGSKDFGSMVLTSKAKVIDPVSESINRAWWQLIVILEWPSLQNQKQRQNGKCLHWFLVSWILRTIHILIQLVSVWTFAFLMSIPVLQRSTVEGEI